MHVFNSSVHALARAITATLAVALVVALAPAVAGAAKIKGTVVSVNYKAANNEANDLTLAPTQPINGNYTFTDANLATIGSSSGTTCGAAVGNSVECPATNVAKIRINLRNGNDKANGRQSAIPLIINGGGGTDVLAGGPAGDRISGGRDNDAGAPVAPTNELAAGVIGKLGADLLRGGAGADVIDSYDNGTKDRVKCGPGVDIVYGDVGIDDIDSDCEDVRAGPSPGEADPVDPVDPVDPQPPIVINNTTTTNTTTGGQDTNTVTQQSGDPCPTGVRAISKSSKIKKRKIKVKLRAPKNAKGTCKGKIRIDALVRRARSAGKPRLRIGSASFSIKPGQSKTFKVKLSKAGRKLVKQRGKVKARVNVYTYRKVAGSSTSSKITRKQIVVRGARQR